MIEVITDIPENVFAFRASGHVTKEDYERIVLPGLDALSRVHEKLNLLIVLDTDVSNFTIGAWMSDMGAGLKHLTKWNRVAIVTEQKGVAKFTDMFGLLVPGEFKGFDHSELRQAKAWVSGMVAKA